MSRKRKPQNEVHHAFGMVRILCPDGHELGRALKQPYDLGFFISGRLVRIDGPEGHTKLKARCTQCEAMGRIRDLQVSWEKKIIPLLSELEADPELGVSDFRIGD